MKTLCNKRRFLAALSATLLIFAALIASCMNPFDEQNKPDDNIIISKGKGIVRISVTDPEARSILPSSLPATSDMHYKVEFKKDSTVVGNTATDADFPSTGRASFSSLDSQPIVLNAGTYNITITAWSATTGGNALAGWTGSAVVNPASSKSVTANLKGWTTSGTGTFTYSITVLALPTATATAWTVTDPPSSYITKKMEIFTEGGTIVNNDSANNPIDPTLAIVGGANSGSISLPSGYYEVKITLAAANCQDRVVTSSLHIYNTLTSSYSYSVPAINQNKFSVAFDLNGEADDDSSCDLTTQDNIDFLGTVDDPGDPGNNALVFDGWFDNAAGSGTAWVFGSGGTEVLKDTTLYAKWSSSIPQIITASAIGGVTAPVAGATPVTNITSNAQYNVAVAWSPTVSGTFAAGTVYNATVTLTAKGSYTLSGVTANFFSVTGAASTISPNVANAGVLTVRFAATDATIATGAVGGVTAPIVGATPAATVTATSEYTGTIEWSPTVSGTFAAGTVYTATITLVPETGYTVFGVGQNSFTVAGTSQAATNSANSGVITAAFPATLTPITAGAIGGVTVPVAGAVPATTVTETSEYTGSIVWDHSNPATFATSTIYTATITLMPKGGFTLTGVAANSFTVAGTSSAATNSANSGVITATFPTTAASVSDAVFTITFSFTDMSISASGSTQPVSYSALLGGSESIIFTLSGGSFTGVTWNMDGVTASGGSNSSLTIDNTSNLLPYLVPGNHVLNVKGTKDSDPNYSANITFVVASN